MLKNQRGQTMAWSRRWLLAAVWCVALARCESFVTGLQAQENTQESGVPTSSSSAAKGVEGGSAEATELYGDAANLQNNREFTVAEEEWTKFLEKFPEDPLVKRVHHYRGVCRMQSDQMAAAIEDFRAALEGDELSGDLREEGLLNLGWCHYTLGAAGESKELPPAMEAFDQLLKDHPKSVLTDQALFYAGEASYLQDKIPEAITFYQRLVEEYPKSERWPDAAYAYGVALQDAGKHEEALQVFESFQKTHARHELAPEMKLRQGESLLMKQEFAVAEPIFASLVKVAGFPAADHALFRQAYCAVAQQKFAEAARLFASLPELFPKSAYIPDAWVSAGNGYYRAENWGEALHAYAEARKARPELTAAMAHWTCRVLLKQGNGNEALQVARAALEKVTEPELKVQLLYDEADALYAIPDQRQAALEAYKKLSDTQKDNPLAGQSLYNAAYAAMDLSEYGQCTQLCEQFLQSFPEHELLADVKHLQAESLLRQGKGTEAEAAFATLIADYPDHPERETWQVQQARSLFTQRAYDKVIQLLEKTAPTMKSAAARAEGLYLIGDSQFYQRDFSAADQSLKQSLEAYADYRGTDLTLLRLAAVQKELGDEDAARGYLEKLQQRFTESDYLDRTELLLGDLDFQAGKLDEADARYTKVIETWPTHHAASLAQLGRGWVLLRRGEPAAAETLFSGVIEKSPGEEVVWEARQARTVARHRQKKFNEALEDAQFVVTTNPKGARVDDTRYLTALCQIATNNKADAVKTLNDMISSSSGYRRMDLVLYELAWLERESNPESSISRFREISERYPKSPHAAEASFHQAEEFYAGKKYAEAGEIYQKLVASKARNDVREKSSYKLGWSFYHQKEWEGARQAFTRLIEDFPNAALSVDARFMIGETWFMERKYDEALDAYASLKGKELPTPASGLLLPLHAGQAARQLGKYDVAIEWLTPLGKAETDSNAKWQAKFELGQAMRQSNRRKEATAEFAEVADHRRDPLGAQARFMLGELLFGDENHVQAVREFQRLMYGYGGEKAETEIREWQVKGGLEAGRCAAIVAEKSTSPQEQREWIEKARKCFAFVLQQKPDSEEAIIAKEQMDRLKGEKIAEREATEKGK
jgi:cellulose synthase operon protein C